MEAKPIQADWTTASTGLPAAPEPLSQSLAKRKQTYYRSKAFISQIGVNALIASAAPIFFLVEKFQQHESGISAQQLLKLREDILHEIRAFEHQALGHQYRSTVLQIARFILCLWTDEMILNTQWGRESAWAEHKLVDQLASEGKDKSFFLMLSQCAQDPPTYLDLLELFYVCLSLGFEGEYRYLERGHILLAEIRDNLYHTIQSNRGEISKQLEIKTEQTQILTQYTNRHWLHAVILASALVVSIGAYFFMNAWLNQELLTTKEIFQQPTTQTGEGA